MYKQRYPYVLFKGLYKFTLDIENHNIVFKDYFHKVFDSIRYKIYEAELINPTCPFCSSVGLIHSVHLKTHVRDITANASAHTLIRMLKQRVKCRDCDIMAQSILVNKYCCISNTLEVENSQCSNRSPHND